MIKAVVFDLDDTLIPEYEYVKSGFRAVSKAMQNDTLYTTLLSLFKENPKNVYQRAGLTEEECKRCIDVYRSHMPDISLSDEVYGTLLFLKSKGIKLGIITDGRPVGQRNKIKALELDKLVDFIIVTDELGGENFRKPNPKPFELMREKLQVEFEEMMYVGDNPQKDFYIGAVYPITTVRLVRDGIYTDSDYLNGIFEHIRVLSISQFKDKFAEICSKRGDINGYK